MAGQRRHAAVDDQSYDRGVGARVAGDHVFVRMDHDKRSGEAVIKVMLCRSKPRANLAVLGGTVVAADGICTLLTAPAVIEAFMYQTGRPGV